MRTFLLLLLLSFLAGCASVPPAMVDEEPLLWPYGAAKPRVAFVKSFSRADDLGIRKNFFRQMQDLFFGAEETRLVRPMAVLVVDGVIYVADPGAHGVHRFDVASGDYRLIGRGDDGDLPSPVGLARGAGGEVYVSDSRLAQVLLIRPGARVATPLALAEPLRQPTGLAYDAASQRLAVVDTAAHQVKIFAADGHLLQRIGQRGNGDGEFNYPTYLSVSPQGGWIVTDSLNFRVQRFDAAGHFLGKFGQQGDGSGDAARQKGVAVDRYGHLYVVDALFHAVQIFDEAGRLLLSIGERGEQRGEFWLPAGLFIDADDSIYIADSANHRVQVLRYIGGAEQ